MKIAMIGSGAAGSVFASYLRRGGADITLVDPYKAHMDAVAQNGMDFTITPDQHYIVEGFKTAYNAEKIGIMDAVIFMTKATHIHSAIETAKPCIGENTVLVSLMNGVGNEDPLLELAPPSRVIYGSGTLGTLLAAPGKCVSSPGKASESLMNFGAVERSELTIAVGEHLEKCFNAGGCPATFWEDVAPAIWKKAIINCVFNPLSALTRLKVRVINHDDDGYALIRMICEECSAVAAAKGVNIPAEPLANALRNSTSPITNYFPSMAQDMLMHERETEITTLNGRISEYGKKFNIPTPANDFIYHMVSVMQRNYDKQYPKVE